MIGDAIDKTRHRTNSVLCKGQQLGPDNFWEIKQMPGVYTGHLLFSYNL